MRASPGGRTEGAGGVAAWAAGRIRARLLANQAEAPAWVTENLRDPGYHTAMGVLYYGVTARGDKSSAPARRTGGLIGQMKRFFVQNQ